MGEYSWLRSDRWDTYSCEGMTPGERRDALIRRKRIIETNKKLGIWQRGDPPDLKEHPKAEPKVLGTALPHTIRWIRIQAGCDRLLKCGLLTEDEVEFTEMVAMEDDPLEADVEKLRDIWRKHRPRQVEALEQAAT